jgi:hypothetical protein
VGAVCADGCLRVYLLVAVSRRAFRFFGARGTRHLRWPRMELLCRGYARSRMWMEAVLRAAAAARCSAVRRSRSSSTRRFVLAIVDTFAIRVGTRFWHCRVGGPGKFSTWRVAHRLLMGGPCRRGVRVDARRRGAPRGRKNRKPAGDRGARETMCSRYGLRVYGRRSLSSWARPTQLESVIGKAGHGVRLGVTATWLM